MAPVKAVPLFEDYSGTATFSDDRRYRYELTRRWGHGDRVIFVMLNPSTADSDADDPTIRRCLGFARAWGYGRLTVLNLYALRATQPRDLWTTGDPVGPDNDAYLSEHVRDTSPLLICAWGIHARTDRVRTFWSLQGSQRAQSLGVTRSGAPRHPLYLPASTEPTPLGDERSRW